MPSVLAAATGTTQFCFVEEHAATGTCTDVPNSIVCWSLWSTYEDILYQVLMIPDIGSIRGLQMIGGQRNYRRSDWLHKSEIWV
jgi:hypothetical protein